MNKLTLPNFNHCKEVLILHERNTNPHYKQLICKLESIQDEKDKVHKPDSEIIVDCHDLSSKKKINIVFVSSDHSLLKFKKENQHSFCKFRPFITKIQKRNIGISKN